MASSESGTAAAAPIQARPDMSDCSSGVSFFEPSLEPSIPGMQGELVFGIVKFLCFNEALTFASVSRGMVNWDLLLPPSLWVEKTVLIPKRARKSNSDCVLLRFWSSDSACATHLRRAWFCAFPGFEFDPSSEIPEGAAETLAKNILTYKSLVGRGGNHMTLLSTAIDEQDTYMRAFIQALGGRLPTSTEDHTPEILQAFANETALYFDSMAFVNITHDAEGRFVRALRDALQKNPTFTRGVDIVLFTRNKKFDGGHLVLLSQGLATPSVSLRLLRLQRCPINTAGVMQLKQAFQANSQAVTGELDLTDARLTSQTRRILSEILLLDGVSLQTLRTGSKATLSEARGDDGVICRALETKPKAVTREWESDFTELSMPDFRAFCRFLSNPETSLHTFMPGPLGHNDLPDAKALCSAFADACAENPKCITGRIVLDDKHDATPYHWGKRLFASFFEGMASRRQTPFSPKPSFSLHSLDFSYSK
eukprot:Cvel_33167.t1-p1 / transcript=Cvel_33167.t1 / gene=Cvel_33167 / organism=Chromera_velia_CCMP2878 / gene_product=hypothetical protein / transcript_product=hypothetical protein / location=Cvel_scaffold5320:140-1579(-) / protein_length=480 / sequence_SO=supercontig / SO=protein_coding / is_pseudo=false